MNSRDIDAYIATAPETAQEKLRTLRAAIVEAVPDATECLSYEMPYYDFHGRLAYVGLAKKHIGLDIPTPVIDQYRTDLEGYRAVQATIHLPLDEEIPTSLSKQLVRARARLNEEADQAKKAGRKQR